MTEVSRASPTLTAGANAPPGARSATRCDVPSRNATSARPSGAAAIAGADSHGPVPRAAGAPNGAPGAPVYTLSRDPQIRARAFGGGGQHERLAGGRDRGQDGLVQRGARTERLGGPERRARGSAHGAEPVRGPALLDARGLLAPGDDHVAAIGHGGGDVIRAPRPLDRDAHRCAPVPAGRAHARNHAVVELPRDHARAARPGDGRGALEPLADRDGPAQLDTRAGRLGEAHAVRGRERELAGRAGRAHAVVVAAQRERLDLAELGRGRRGRRGEQRQGDQGDAHQRTLTVVRAGRPGSPIVRRVT